MAGDKIKQARNALKYLVTKLNDGDRSTSCRSPASPIPGRRASSAKERARTAPSSPSTLIAQGGTDIAGASRRRGSCLDDRTARPSYIVFMTDGKPTMGETTDPKKILAKVIAARGGKGGESLRVFTWGVGYDLDTHLLDDMANRGGGVSEYVRPEEDIAAKIAAFANKAAQPDLTGLDLKILGDKVQLVNVHPRTLPDLYAGGQVVLFGRYTGDGDLALQLTGRVNGKSETFTYEGKFSASESKFAFIEMLWAQRRIGHLLDEIRLHGETKELVDDVIRLSKEYGIQTPYTSQLILEDDRRLGRGEPLRKDLAAATGGGRNAPMSSLAVAAKKLDGVREKESRDAPKPATVPPPAAEPARAPVVTRGRRRALDRDGNFPSAASTRRRGQGGASTWPDGCASSRRRNRRAMVRRRSFRRPRDRFFLYNEMWVDEKFRGRRAGDEALQSSAASLCQLSS
jgi:hypothetical protein